MYKTECYCQDVTKDKNLLAYGPYIKWQLLNTVISTIILYIFYIFCTLIKGNVLRVLASFHTPTLKVWFTVRLLCVQTSLMWNVSECLVSKAWTCEKKNAFKGNVVVRRNSDSLIQEYKGCKSKINVLTEKYCDTVCSASDHKYNSNPFNSSTFNRNAICLFKFSILVFFKFI